MSPSKKKTTSKKAAKKKTAKKKAAKKKTSSSKKTAAKKKSSSSQKIAAKKTAAKKAEQPSRLAITPEERWKMIAIAAYHKAEKRNFAPGNDFQDWVDAEKEIDKIMQG